METFNKNDSSSGGEGPRPHNSQPELTFEQNLELFIQRFSAAGQNTTSHNDNQASGSGQHDVDNDCFESDAEQQPTNRTCQALRDSLNSSEFTPIVRAKDGKTEATRAKHHRYETQIQIIKEENFERGDFNSSTLANSETKKDQNVGLVKNINDLVENYSNSNQSSVARFGFQSSHIRTKTLAKNSQQADKSKVFDISQRSTMMQGVDGPNHQVEIQEHYQKASDS